LVAIGSFFLWTSYLWKIFSSGYAGSYPHVETWSFNLKERDLIKIIEEIKNEHPELKEPNSSADERFKYWYKIGFYYRDTNEDVYTWTRSNADSVSTTFAFVAIATHVDSSTPEKDVKMDRREINNDFGYFENRKQINKFENKIVKLIEQKIKK
jgi:hypothetical protein